MKFGLSFALLALYACAPPDPGSSSVAPASTGAHLFAEKCGACHHPGGMGTLLIARRKDGQPPLLEARNLEQEQVKQSVRSGMGNMPALSRGELSDDELDAIAAYLAAKR